MDGFTVTICRDEVLVVGDVCLDTAPVLEAAIAAADAGPVTIDLRCVTFFGAVGATVLFNAADRGLQVLVRPKSLVASVLEILRLDEVATVLSPAPVPFLDPRGTRSASRTRGTHSMS
jgi:anti-anti-sigma regulatory factor